MNADDKYIVELAKASIFDQIPANPEEGIDWNYIFKKANEQNIVGLLYCAVSKLDGQYQPGREIMEKWNKLMLTTMGVMTQKYYEFQRMCKIITDRGIRLIGLKGCIVRELYPVPELRTMGDFDVLVRKEDLGEVTEIFKEEGYRVEKDLFNIVCNNGNGMWEVFTTMGEEFRNISEKIDETFFNSCVEDVTIDYPQPTYFLAHLIAHTGKHYVTNGAGIRNLCDIALFIDNYKPDIDFKKVKEVCEEEGYRNIYRYVINSVNEWFGVDISGIETEKEDSEKFMEYSLEYGLLGLMGSNSLAIQVAKQEDDSVGGIRKMMFPTVKLLDYRYTYLKKWPFLLPVAWVHRFFAALFKRGCSVRQMVGEVKGAVEFADKRTDWLNELGLMEEH